MFLATTGLKKYWKESGFLYLLGDRCKTEQTQAYLSRRSYDVIESPWRDPNLREKGISFCRGFYERALKEISEYLNGTHGVNCNTRYWRIIVGPWLFYYINVLYDRYSRISIAYSKHPKLCTGGISLDKHIAVYDWNDFIAKVYSDHYNFYVYSLVMQSLNIPYSECNTTEWYNGLQLELGQTNARYILNAKLSYKGVLNRWLEKFLSVYSKNSRVVINDLFNRKGSEYKLLLKSFLRVKILTQKNEISPVWTSDDISQNMRGRFRDLQIASSADRFSKIFKDNVGQDFPFIYLEGYDKLREMALSQNVDRKIIASTYGWKSNDIFKCFAAEANKRGALLIGAQHGGNNGIEMDNAPDRHIADVVDRFYTFGNWAVTNKDYPNAIPGTALVFNPYYTDNIKVPSENEPIIFVGTNKTRYLLYLRHGIYINNYREYQNWQIRFIASLPESLRSKIIFRLTDKEWGSQDLYKREFGALSFDDFSMPFQKRILKSKLVIIDNLNTTFTEALLLNRPVILYMDLSYYRLYEEGEKYFNKLNSAGILFFSPEEAAEQLCQVEAKPLDWWSSLKVQNVRNDFIAKFVIGGEGKWLNQWMKLLKSNPK